MKKIITLILVLMLILTGCDFVDGVFGNKENDTISDTEITGPSDSNEKLTVPENNEPEHNEPENNEPENNQPENNQPENNEPENNQPENNEPENNDPENNEPENNEPENNEPENNEPENNEPENNEPENNQPENNEPENNEPENNQPENNEPENNQPENNESEKVPETNHNYKATVTAPTCLKAGYTTYVCTICGDSYTTNLVSAKGHIEVSIPATAATCTATGLTAGKKCSVCGTVTVAQQTVAAKGHTPGVAATCTTAQTCTVCKVTITVATGHNWKAATTEAPKTCITCGATEGDKLASTTPSLNETLYVYFINVGQGDSILIKVGDCDILIDAGIASKGSTVSSYLKSKGVDDIELMINSHPDSDHCGGLTTVLNDFVVEQVWISKDTSKTSATYTDFTDAIKAEGLTAKQPSAGTTFTYQYLSLTVLYSAKGSDSNNSSIVVMLEYGSFKFLFTGDAGKEVEDKLLSSGTNLSCDVLKVGHHGSAGSSTAAFLSATGADYGVICVGSNSYGHPTATALNNLSSAGIMVYRTDTSGNIVFSTNGATLYLPGGGTDTSGSGSGTSSGGSSGESSSTDIFVGNTETKVFHLPTCSNLPTASKQNLMYDYWWIVNIAGYTPCGRCLKNYTPDSSGSGSGGTLYYANTASKVYHLTTCSYLPDASNITVITSTSGYTPCGHCIKSSSTTKYILNTDNGKYHLPTCSYLPAESKQEVIYDPTGYSPCGHCIK